MPPLDDTNQEVSLRDELVSAFASNRGESNEQPKTTPASPPVESKVVESSPVESKVAAPAAPTAAAAKSAADATADTKPIEPPARWTKEQKEEFAALDPNVQRILLGRNKGLEQDYTRKMMEIGQERKRYGGFEAILSPRRDQWKSAGLSDEQALNQIFSYWDHAQRDPGDFIKTFAQQRGIDLAAMFAPSPQQLAAMMHQAQGGSPAPGANGQPHAQAAVHPAVLQELESLKRQVHTQGMTLQQRAQYEHSAIVNAASDELSSFVSATDEHGQPLHPFIDEVRADMAMLMSSGRANTLKEAYNLATRMNESVSAQIRESAEIGRRREEESRRAAEAERARRASSSVSPSASGAAPSPPPTDNGEKSIRDLLAEGFAKARAGERI